MRQVLERTVDALTTRCVRLAADDRRGEVILDLEREGGRLEVRLGKRGFSLEASKEAE